MESAELMDEKAEAKRPSKATGLLPITELWYIVKGAKLAITVHLGKLDDELEVLDTTEVWALRDAIKANFAKTLEPYAPPKMPLENSTLWAPTLLSISWGKWRSPRWKVRFLFFKDAI